MNEAWREQADAVERSLGEELPSGIVGVYVHGSAALGGWRPGSDLDVLVVVSENLDADWRGVGDHVLSAVAGGIAVELSVISAGVAKTPTYAFPYLVHVASGDDRVGTDRGNGDPDLLMHVAVTRAAGIALVGPPPDHVLAEVPRELLITYLRDELAWGLDHADATYAVLNACRAMAFAAGGAILSKVAGAEWGRRQWPEHSPLIDRALGAHNAGEQLGRASVDDRAFVEAVAAALS